VTSAETNQVGLIQPIFLQQDIGLVVIMALLMTSCPLCRLGHDDEESIESRYKAGSA
jgi:hypothetical protein